MIKSSLKPHGGHLVLTLVETFGWTNVWYTDTQGPMDTVYSITIWHCMFCVHLPGMSGCSRAVDFNPCSAILLLNDYMVIIYGGCDDNVMMITDKALTSNPILVVNSMRELLTFVQSSVSPLLHGFLLFGHLVNSTYPASAPSVNQCILEFRKY